MNSRKALFALLAGAALTTVIGILLTPYRDSSKRKKIAHKSNGTADEVRKELKETVSDVKKQIKTMEEDVDRMVNEGGQ
jgi:gas vesicle protein